MAPFDIKFSRGTQFTFGSLTFTTGEVGDLKMLPLEAALERLVLVHGPDPCSSANSSTSDGACSGLDPCAGLFLHTVQGILVMTSILHHRLEHRDRHHRLRPLITTQLMTTLRLGAIPTGTAVKRVA
jgi:hypothetical protein